MNKLPNNSSQIHIVGQQPSDNAEVCTPQTFEYDLRLFLQFRKNPKATAKLLFYLIGVFGTPLSILGAVLGYCRSYKKLWFDDGILPRLHNLPKVFKVAIGISIVAVWLGVIVIIGLLAVFFSVTNIFTAKFLLTYFAVNAFFSLAVMIGFRKWIVGIYNLLTQTKDFGSAHLGTSADLRAYSNEKPGIYLGGSYNMSHKGHITTFASTRSGKGANLIIPNLLGRGGYKGSWVVLDIKGENAAVCGKLLKAMGKRVIYLNVWDILPDLIKGNGSFNPFDMFPDSNSEHCIDEIALLAEMIIPLQEDSENAFFINSARNVLAGLMLHLICRDGKKATLVDLWHMTRLSGDDWNNLLLEMFDSKHPVYADAIKNAAKECAKIMEAGETWSSIVSNVIEATAFLKSRPVQRIFQSGIDPYSIADGNTVIFIIFPFSKLKSHSQVLRLMITALMQSVVNKPGKKVTFLLDEASCLGYMSCLEQAMTGYAGFNITLWQIFQDLSQLKAIYGERWETIWANSDVRQVFGIRDLFSQKYISESLGTKTVTKYKTDFLGNVLEVDSKGRELMTPDEVRGASHDSIFLFTGENPVVLTPKLPYYLMPNFKKDGANLYEPNPYIEDAA